MTKKPLPQWPFLLTGTLLVLDTVLAASISSINAGVLMPAVLGSPLLLYGIWKQRWDNWFNSKRGKAFRLFVLACYGLFLTLFIICVGLMLTASHNRVTAHADYVIVLGASLQGKEVSKPLQCRLDTAYKYARDTDTLIILSGGQGPDEITTEASAMASYLQKIGCPLKQMILEEQSVSTKENFLFSKEIMDARSQNHTYTAVYVTNDFHLYRSGMTARSVGLDIDGIAAPTYPICLLPNYYLRETLAILRDYLFGIGGLPFLTRTNL